PFRTDPADRFEFGEGFPHPDDPGAAAGRVEDDVRQFPTQLLGQLDAHRLLALDAVGLSQGRAVEPAGLPLALADELAAIVDQSVDEKYRGALDRDLADIDRRSIVGTEDISLDAGARAISGHRRPRIAV